MEMIMEIRIDSSLLDEVNSYREEMNLPEIDMEDFLRFLPKYLKNYIVDVPDHIADDFDNY